ncbi:protein-L-isoaspartate(D-aspartate) O-methyltransferase [Haloarcula sp. CBA1130]|uniref:protein-L-isoaspartate(D-aspartate) O-methyltransferase n=1 Tax=unclassified Haloarcula TaxID=2624677 RepID=UPI001244A3AB|nr:MULTISPECIES: protein-L-isoaspartate(D-aspartate) O-methyltransferase [unclassified Haloarcula]KAA9399769.1 protein-L-isoaspartate(D-aspartate) O-methyltransferase [Haloarcula sp. CBA1129]KAA9401465.1 protein-L-isoaspartate(D-aspartate) O-methyltransferase [Haloarcula sp. CBA1130]
MADWGRERSRLADRLRERIDDEAVLAAIASVPRHLFVPADKRRDAYADRPLPIGSGQTISAPHMVAIMADLLDLSPGDRVLEIGTGCGYHAAVTAELVGPENVYSVEYHASLAEAARETLEATGYGAVSVRAGDGKEGWPEHAPYDRTYLTCAAPDYPAPLIDQTRDGGVLLAPLGDGQQRLVRARKRADGTLDRTDHGGVRFVPLR